MAPDGYLYVADRENARVQKLDTDGNFILSFGQLGLDPGEFYWPEGIAIGPDGDIFVTDSQTGRVQRFDSNGQFLETVATGLVTPRGIAADAEHLYVAEEGASRIRVLDLPARSQSN